MKKSLYVVGSINVDLMINTPRMPKQGETIKGSQYKELPGGKGANQAIAAALLGANTYMVANVGDDLHGQFSLTNFKQNKVNTNFVHTQKNYYTGLAMIVKSEQDNRIILDLGANDTLTQEMVNVALQHIKKDDVVLAQLENPIDVIHTSLKKAKESGATTILNPAPAQSLPDEIYQSVDFIVLNETEATFFTGIEPSDETAYQQIANYFLEKGVRFVILTLGARGSLIIDQTQMIFKAAFAIKTIDTTGAGDAFIGGFIAAYLQGKPLETCLNYANATGALLCQVDGAQWRDLSIDALAQFMTNQHLK